MFSERLDKQDVDNEVSDETELFNNLNVNHNWTEMDINNIDIESPLEHQIQSQEKKDNGWRFDKNNSMTISFYKIGEIILCKKPSEIFSYWK